MQLIDEARIFVKSGNGGNGSASFRREKFIDKGGPDGGDGGNGGSVYIQSDKQINTLLSFKHKKHFKAESGKNGQGSNKTGKSGNDIRIKVPVGTQLFSEANSLIHDFTKNEQNFLLLKGGKGGLGNVNFKSSTNQTPRKFTKGKNGEEMLLFMKLKLLSDVGIIGMPNAGKSTLLSKITAAKSKIADYPFTTLSPVLGVVKHHDLEYTVADIPGIISGASSGVGLGYKFLKHIERCGILIHLIDIMTDSIVNTYISTRKELENYSQILNSKDEIIIFNKIELLSKEEVQKKVDSFKEKYHNKNIYSISCELNYGINDVLEAISRKLKINEYDHSVVNR